MTAPGVNDTSPATSLGTYMYVLYATVGKIANSIQNSHISLNTQKKNSELRVYVSIVCPLTTDHAMHDQTANQKNTRYNMCLTRDVIFLTSFALMRGYASSVRLIQKSYTKNEKKKRNENGASGGGS